MNALFAAGLFDSPWVIAAIVIGSALANWLAKRRQEKQARQQSSGDEPSPPSNKPPGEFNLEETLRRLMGEEPPPPAPPPIPRVARGELAPARPWSAEEPLVRELARPPAQPTPPVLRPPIVVTQVRIMPREISETDEQTAQRFEQLNEQGRHPATVVTHKRQPVWRRARRSSARWRDARSVRRAFVASLVFAPPKSFEP